MSLSTSLAFGPDFVAGARDMGVDSLLPLPPAAAPCTAIAMLSDARLKRTAGGVAFALFTTESKPVPRFEATEVVSTDGRLPLPLRRKARLAVDFSVRLVCRSRSVRVGFHGETSVCACVCVWTTRRPPSHRFLRHTTGVEASDPRRLASIRLARLRACLRAAATAVTDWYRERAWTWWKRRSERMADSIHSMTACTSCCRRV